MHGSTEAKVGRQMVKLEGRKKNKHKEKEENVRILASAQKSEI